MSLHAKMSVFISRLPEPQALPPVPGPCRLSGEIEGRPAVCQEEPFSQDYQGSSFDKLKVRFSQG